MTDGPDELLRGLIDGDTPGPEATAEQETFVTGLLASLRTDDPGIPDDVARRLDAVLAEELRGSAGAVAATPLVAVPPLADAADAADTADAAPAALPDNVSVLPQRSASRGPSTRSFKLVTGIAAATVLVAGAAVVSSGVLGGSAGDTSGGAPVAAAVIQDSGTAYSSKDLDTQAERLVDRAYTGNAEGGAESPATPEATSQASPGVPDPSITATDAAPPVPLTADSLVGCVDEITEGEGGEPLLVDQGSYDGKAAIVIVLPALDEAGSVDVWVVAAGCSTGTATIYDFRRLPTP